ncbi:hypothetical protein H2202_000202 [Exophiala xenobiotica]|nr:hypothetical protein H2202_000202 [Exophiala xenobiotica]KAK5236923.1 hypothetical protein LTR47_002101 [Exophiala xenobiotica]KAK5252124.1 hypothetical protein LTS06_003215 [Exophiala xenobiotica]KAK5356482.1 hypothetical protein LTR61_000217 [Exophiala xenobiotica]KAK5370952.1 hypothetical protein LTS03_007316 [Exophiala xenobiotica]
MGVQEVFWHVHLFAFLFLLVNSLHLAASSELPTYVKENAPIIWLHSDDPFMPSDILSHVLHTKPYKKSQPIPDVPDLGLDNLSSLNDYGTNIFLTSIDNVTSHPSWLRGETPETTTGALHNSTACAVVLINKTDSILDAFYFYFYSYDEGADITQVLPPLNRLLPDAKPGDHFGNHVGDWEHNMIRFKDGVPYGIWFSQHGSGEVCLWEDTACLSKQGDRPVVYSARGSHANYPSAGSHVHDSALVDVADKGRIWDPVQPAWIYSYNAATDVLTALEPINAPTDWFHFTGGWGDKQYSDKDPRQSTVPYFGLKKYNNGPAGPKFKHLLRKGLQPDERPKGSLMRTAVEIYMSMYGCCLKGINPWVVVIAILLFLAVTTFLVIFVIRRLIAPAVRSRLLSRERDEKQSGSIMSRLKVWLFKKNKRRPEGPSEFSLRLLDPEQAEDDS